MKTEANLKHYLPHAVAATFLVVVLPLLLQSALSMAGLVRSPFVAIAFAVILSGFLATAGAAWWSRRLGSRDVVFAELLVWGLVRRLRTERRLARASGMLGIGSDAAITSATGRRGVRVLEQLSSALEARDACTHGHSRRIARLSHMIATEMGLDSGEVAKIRTAAAIHDIGKLNVPRAILNKPSRLTDEEFEIMRRHPADGAAMAAGIDDPDVVAMIMHHHERLDGSGYPDRLAGEQIPLGARIIAVADTFDSITSTRPYRAAVEHTRAIEVLEQEAGSRLDARAVSAFMSYYSGRKGIELWAFASQVPQHVGGWLGGMFRGVGAPVSQVAATVAATAMVGGAALGPKVDRDAPARAHADTAPMVAPYEATGSRAENVRPSARAGRHRPRAHRRSSAGADTIPGATPQTGATPETSDPTTGTTTTAPSGSEGIRTPHVATPVGRDAGTIGNRAPAAAVPALTDLPSNSDDRDAGPSLPSLPSVSVGTGGGHTSVTIGNTTVSIGTN